MIYKQLSGTTLSWSINLPETKWLYSRRRIHCPVSVLIRKNKEEMHIILDSLTHLVDLLIREFDEGGINILGVPALSLKRALKAISDYFGSNDDFISDLEYEYFRYLIETGLVAPYGILTPIKLKELYEQSMMLKGKLSELGSSTTANELEILQDAIEILDKYLEDMETPD